MSDDTRPADDMTEAEIESALRRVDWGAKRGTMRGECSAALRQLKRQRDEARAESARLRAARGQLCQAMHNASEMLKAKSGNPNHTKPVAMLKARTLLDRAILHD